MVNAVHAVVYAQEAEATRAFFRDVLNLPAVDAGRGWLIFALPPVELGVHPADAGGKHELYLMCDDVERTVEELKARGVEFTKPVKDAGFGLLTYLKIPGAGEIGLYEPKHASPLADLKAQK